MSDKSSSAKSISLLQEIAHCPNAMKILAEPEKFIKHPCYVVVNAQKKAEWRMPVPWTGNPLTAKIVFLSSNPSINGKQFHPKIDCTVDMIVDFYTNHFTPKYNNIQFARNFRCLLNDGEKYSKKPIRFWTGIQRYAERILAPERPVPGETYMMTEIVHCKSDKQAGVAQALDTCGDLYFKRIIDICVNARLFILVGAAALEYGSRWFAKQEKIQPEKLKKRLRPRKFPDYNSVVLLSSGRFLAWLPHTSASFKNRRAIVDNQIENIRKALDSKTLQRPKK